MNMSQNDTKKPYKKEYIYSDGKPPCVLYSDGSHREITKEDLTVVQTGCEVCEHFDISKCLCCDLSGDPNPEAFTRQELVDGLWGVHCYTEALTPSGDTKAAYIGEFEHVIYDLDEDGKEHPRSITVPWTTIKDIMKAIRDRADSHRKPS